MAKSIRSKRKRKFRAIKREKIGKREMVKLKKMLGVNEDGTIDAEMKEICTVTKSTKMKTRADTKRDDSKMDSETQVHGEKMEVDAKKSKKDSMVNEHGNYPGWMSRRTVKKIRDRKKNKIKYAW